MSPSAPSPSPPRSPDMTLLEKAIEIALKAHAGQKDKAGEPYILHPLRVMGMMSTVHERVVAVLHDVLEDTGIAWGDLFDEGVPHRASEQGPG